MFTDDQTLDLALRIAILGPLTLLWITLVVRVIGLRSFSKMIAPDFVVTIATGSLLANAASADTWPVFLQSSGTMAMLLLAQAAFTWARRRWKKAKVLENTPAVLFRNGEFCEAAMAENRISRGDVIAKLREANVLEISEVHAVVLETTGDISVLHGGMPDDLLLEGTDGNSRSNLSPCNS